MGFPVPNDYARHPVVGCGAGTLRQRIALMFASHASLASQPVAVADLIDRAAKAVAGL